VFLPIPYGVEGGVRRGPPRATAALLAVNVLVFLLTLGGDARRIEKEEASLERLAGWELQKLGERRPGLKAAVAGYPSAIAFLTTEPSWREQVGDEAVALTLAGHVEEYRALTARHPFHRFGFIPARVTARGLLGHMFLHADLVHLGFNLLFLWVVGVALEGDWGAARFAGFYLAAGLAAAFAHGLSQPHSVEPAIGASGAVAGLMGAFAVAHRRDGMRLLLVYGLGIAAHVRTTVIPAGVFLGFWLAEQAFWALMTVRIRSGVAFVAHLGGFAFGAAVSLGLCAFARRGSGTP
jgi:membrane associated rhomboid family serine protease